LIANYHTHTFRCRHAEGTEEEYIQYAISMGWKVLGFSDHVPYPFPNGYESTIRMRVAETENYVSTLASLREKYKDQIKILIGYETEYFSELFPACLDNLEKYGYDYLILGHHFRSVSDGYLYNGRPTTSIEIVKRYVEECIAGLETGKFVYIAHPDLVDYVGSDMDAYSDYMRELCIAAKEMDIPLEWNVLGMTEGRCYPGVRFFDIAATVGNKVIIGADAHSVADLTNTDAFNYSEKKVREYGFELITMLDI